MSKGKMNLKRIKNPIQILFGVLILISFYYLPNFKANYNFDHFIPVQDPYYSQTQSFKNEIGDGDQYIMLAVVLNQSIFDSSSVALIHSVTKRIEKMTHVEGVISLSNTQDVIKGPSGWIKIQTMKKGKTSYHEDSIRLTNDPRIRRWLVSDDATSFCLFIRVKKDLTEEEKTTLIVGLEELQYPAIASGYHIAGKINTEIQYIRILENENIKLTPIFLIVVLLVIYFFYRTWQSLLITFISLLTSLILMYGYASFIGRTLNLSSLMYPTIIVVIGTSDLIHFYSKYLILRSLHNRWDSISIALRELRSVLFLTSLTTAIGFLTIATSTIPQVHQFGVDGIVGIFIALMVTLFFTPIVITWFPDSKTARVSDRWLTLASIVVRVTSHRKGSVVSISLMILVLSIIGFSKVSTNNKIIGNIADSHQLAIDYHFFESQYAGVRKIQFMIVPKKGSNWHEEASIIQFEKLEKFISSQPESRYVLSSLTALRSYNKATNGGSWDFYTVPQNTQVIARFKKEYTLRGMNLYGYTDTSKGYIVVSCSDTGREEVAKTIDKITVWIKENIDDSQMEVVISGNDLLIDKNNEYLVNEMFTSFGLAFVLIAILVGWLFRSWLIVLVSMTVNILPLLMTGGLMGFLGIPLSGTTAIIFTIGFVIAVDDTIHFMTRYKNERMVNQDGAIDKTVYSVTQPIVITSVILVAGYSVPIFSSVRDANNQGILIGATLLFAMLADLFLLPTLLKLIKGE